LAASVVGSGEPEMKAKTSADRQQHERGDRKPASVDRRRSRASFQPCGFASEQAVGGGEERQQQRLRPRQRRQRPDQIRQRRQLRALALVEVAEQSGGEEGDEERHLHPRGRGEHEPVGEADEQRGKRGAARRELEAPP
jgi:hypothetical protein